MNSPDGRKDRRKVRRSKIAHLPASIRMEVARRLNEGHSGRATLEWLNGEPAVVEAMWREFKDTGNIVISDNNLSTWLKSAPPEMASAAGANPE